MPNVPSEIGLIAVEPATSQQNSLRIPRGKDSRGKAFHGAGKIFTLWNSAQRTPKGDSTGPMPKEIQNAKASCLLSSFEF